MQFFWTYMINFSKLGQLEDKIWLTLQQTRSDIVFKHIHPSKVYTLHTYFSKFQNFGIYMPLMDPAFTDGVIKVVLWGKL